MPHVRHIRGIPNLHKGLANSLLRCNTGRHSRNPEYLYCVVHTQLALKAILGKN